MTYQYGTVVWRIVAVRISEQNFGRFQKTFLIRQRHHCATDRFRVMVGLPTGGPDPLTDPPGWIVTTYQSVWSWPT